MKSAPRKIVSVGLIVIAAVLAVFLVAQIPGRLDLTSEKIYTLSTASRSLCAQIQEPVTLSYYYSRSVKGLPTPFKNYANRIEEMLRQYESAADGSIRLQIVDPRPDSEGEKAAIAAGLYGEPLPTGDLIFLGLVATQAENTRTIPLFDPQKESFLEYELSRLVSEVQRSVRPTITIVTSLDLTAPPARAIFGQTKAPDQFLVEELRRSFEVEIIKGFAEELPEPTDVLALIHPHKLSDELRYAIDQHVVSGRPTFVAVDPFSRYVAHHNSEASGVLVRPKYALESDLNEFFLAWGVQYDPAQVVADMTIAYTEPNFVQPTWLVLSEAQQNKHLLPLAGIRAGLLIEPGCLSLVDTSPLTLQPALSSTAQAGLVPSATVVALEEGRIARDTVPQGRTVILAGLLKGTVRSVFPEGPPDGVAPSGTAHRATGEATVFVVADVDWLLDRFSITRARSPDGSDRISRINDNQSLVANVFDFLAGSPDLISIRGKGTLARPFDVVAELEKQAQQKFQSKLATLEQHFTSVRKEIVALAEQQAGSQSLVATPEMNRAMISLREQETALRNEIRSMRLALRREIENLEMKLAGANMLYVPVLLVGVALLYDWRRKKTGTPIESA